MFASFSHSPVDVRAACLLLILSGCHRESPDSSKHGQVTPVLVVDRLEKFGMPTSIIPGHVVFAKACVRERFLAADAAARKIAQPDWSQKASVAYSNTSWNPGYETYSGSWAKRVVGSTGEQFRQSNHTICIRTNLHHDPQQAYGFTLEAELKPEAGWIASFQYILYDGLNGFKESFAPTFRHPRLLPAPPHASHGLRFGRDLFWSTYRQDKEHYYTFAVRGVPARERSQLQKPVSSEIIRYWSSATSFREIVLEELKRLEDNARSEILSGEAATVRSLIGVSGENPPKTEFDVKVPKSITADVLDEAVREIEMQKELIGEHYQAIHAALVATFPTLPEVLVPSRRK